MVPTIRYLTALALMAAMLPGQAWSQEEARSAQPTAEELGLFEVDARRFDEVWLAETSTLSGYRKVFIESPDVSFRKRWKTDQNRYHPRKVTDSDVERIKTDLAQLMVDTFASELADSGFEVVDAPGEGVLIMRPDIVELDVIAPDTNTAGRSYSYSESAGRLTLLLQLRDGSSNDVIGQVRDQKRDPRRNYIEWRTRVSNTATAKRLVRGWARDLGKALNEEQWSANGST